MKRAWLVVIGCFIGVSVSIAPAYLSVFGLFLKPMTEDLGLSRTEMSLGPSIMALVAAACSPFVGALVDRWGARRVALLGVLLLPLGLLAHSMLGGELAVFVGLSLVMGLAASVACPLPYVSALPQWFDRNLGLAIALAMTGIGFGQIVLPKLSAYLIASGGWRQAWIVLAALLLAIGVANLTLLFRDNPEFRSRAISKPNGLPSSALEGLSLREAVRSPAFWLLGAAVCLVAQVGVGLMIHVVPLLTDRGVSPVDAANAVVVLGAGSLLGRLLTGFALDRLSIAIVGGSIFALQGAGVLLLWATVSDVATYAGVFFVGLAVGAETDIIPFAARRKFGMRQFGKVFGALYGIFSIGPMLGPLLMGSAFDRFGSYDPALLAFAASALLASVFVVLAGRIDTGFTDVARNGAQSEQLDELPVSSGRVKAS